MNNLCNKVVVTSVGIALGFAVGVNKEAKAATFSFTPTSEVSVNFYTGRYETQSPDSYGNLPVINVQGYADTRVYYNFNNLSNFFRDTNPYISQAKLRISGYAVPRQGAFDLRILAYASRNNGTFDYNYSEFPISDSFTLNGYELYLKGGYALVEFDVTAATNWFRGYQDNNDGLSSFGFNIYGRNYTRATLASPTLEITAVPEPTTIIGSAIGICLGGWMKRKKSSQQNKTTSQH
jgi:hypothetical protein